MSFCTVPARHGDVERQQDDRGRIDRHRRRYPVERNAGEELRHVLDGVDGHPDPANFASRQRMVRVVAHLRRQVEGHAETADTLGKQVAISCVRLGRGPEAGVLPHRPQTAAIHRRLDAAGVRELPRETQIAGRIPALQ
jgi:hypothetical protein